MSTRGASGWVVNTPTGLPDCTSSVSSSSSSRNVRQIASNDAQFRAALPVPPYTTRSAGRSATSGSRLFMSMRSAASCCQPLQESVAPRGARMIPRLVGVSMVESGIAAILLHSARVGQALLPVLTKGKGEQARVPVLLCARKFDCVRGDSWGTVHGLHHGLRDTYGKIAWRDRPRA